MRHAWLALLVLLLAGCTRGSPHSDAAPVLVATPTASSPITTPSPTATPTPVPSAPASVNLVQNGGFEANDGTRADSWQQASHPGDGPALDCAQAHEGACSMALRNPGHLVTQEIALEPGAYRVSLWAQARNLTAGTVVRVVLRYENATGNVGAAQTFAATPAEGEWKELAWNGTAPPSTTRARLSLDLLGPAPPYPTCWVDEVVLSVN